MTIRLHNLKPACGIRKRKKRRGRGESSGLGKTAGRGHKGQKARAGSGIRPGFEGGQMPLYRRLPKKGFSNAKFKQKVIGINLSRIAEKYNDGDLVNDDSLREHGLASGKADLLKILGDGELDKKLKFSVYGASEAAVKKIEKAGGSIEILAKPIRYQPAKGEGKNNRKEKIEPKYKKNKLAMESLSKKVVAK